jgi:hypothetical protein
MIRKTEEQLRKAQLVKVARAVLTLKYRIELDRELNDVLPDLEEEFDRAVQHGMKPGEVNLRALVQNVLTEGER